MDYETRQMGLNQFLELHKQEQKMRLLMEHISDLDHYSARRKQLLLLEDALNVYTAKLRRATKTSFQETKDKDEAIEEARNRLTDSLFERVDNAYIRVMNTRTDVLRLRHECDSRKEQISELSFELNRLRAKMIRMKNPCYKR